MKTTLVLSRHGQTVWHRENRYAGVSDIDLTETGVAQAEALAAWARAHRPDAIVCSPVRRAQESARPTALALGIEPEVLDDLREIDFGVAEGRTISELQAEDPEMVQRFLDDPVTHHFPDAESPADAARRADAVLRRIAVDHPGETVLVVAHNTLIRVGLCVLIGVPVNAYRTVFPRLGNGTLTTISLPPDQSQYASLHSYNVPLSKVEMAQVDAAPARPNRPSASDGVHAGGINSPE